MKLSNIMGLLGIFATLSANIAAYAIDTPSQVVDATNFFSQVLEETQNPVVAKLVQESLTRLHGSGLRQSPLQVEVPLVPSSQSSLMVQMLINKRITGVFAVDTGASYTVITPAMARQLNVYITPDTPRINIITANGSIYAPLVTLSSITIGTVTLRNVPVIVQDLGKSSLISGLLGLNFFKNMELTIKPDRLILGIATRTQ